MSADAALMLSTGARTASHDHGPELGPILSSLSASPQTRRFALAVVLVSLALFAVSVPFAALPMPKIWAFIPLYQAALVVNDAVTAVLLFGLFGATRSGAILALAGGYVFNAAMAIAHGLSFPGLFAPAGLIGGGDQTTAWLYFLWHGAFPILVVGYVCLRRSPRLARPNSGGGTAQVFAAIAAALAAALGLTLLATAGHDALPVIMSGNNDLPAKYIAAWGTCLLCAGAVFVLWREKSRSVLDLWLMVVMCAWVFDVALSAVFNAGRFSLGFYAGRVYGLLAASMVLVALLVENGRLYARLVEAQRGERRLAGRALARQAERLRILHDIDRAAASAQAPQAIAVAAIGPLRELLGVPRAIVNLFNLEAGEVQWLAAAGRSRTHSGAAVRYSIDLMGNLEALKRGEPQCIDTRSLPAGPEREALLASGVLYYMVMPMITGGTLIGALSFGDETREFPEEQMSIAREAAMQLAVAISQARLLERVSQQAEELEQRVRERTADLEAANRELESFSYSVSHDLRTPLRAIDGFSQMLEEDCGPLLDDEARRKIGVVRSNATRMGRLIDDLLQFSRVASTSIAHAPFDMNALAREVVGELAPAHPDARIEIGPLPAAPGDRALLKQVWTNLVGNALKYSAQRVEPHVQIGGSEEGGEAVYRVRDNGAGFDMRYAGKLFNVFQRLHGPDEFEGTGVGLAIVQRIVTRHAGRVWAEGEVGVGAHFSFALPREQ